MCVLNKRITNVCWSHVCLEMSQKWLYFGSQFKWPLLFFVLLKGCRYYIYCNLVAECTITCYINKITYYTLHINSFLIVWNWFVLIIKSLLCSDWSVSSPNIKKFLNQEAFTRWVKCQKILCFTFWGKKI